MKIKTLTCEAIIVWAIMLAGLAIAPVSAMAMVMKTNAKQAIVVDVETGQVLLEKDADTPMATSSMSKVMTIYAVFDALKKKKLSLDDTFVVSEKAWRKGGSRMFLEVESRVSVEDLIRGVIVQSGNDAAITLAEGLAGQEEFFAHSITAQAAQLGMKRSNFVNASGWPDPEHYSTARDLAILAQSIVEDFPEYYHYFSEKEFKYNNINQRNRNPLIYRNFGADGMKTGHTKVGGYGLMGTGVRDGRRVVIVVNGLDSAKARAQEGARLLEWGLLRFEHKGLFKAGDVVAETPVKFGKSKAVQAIPASDVLIAMPILRGEDATVRPVFDEGLIAPIAKGQAIGRLDVTLPQADKPLTFELVAAQAVEEKGFIGKVLERIPELIRGKSSGQSPGTE